MPRLQVKLDPGDDRIVNLEVEDGAGRKYHVGLEFLAHHFGDRSDDVQVRICKLDGANEFHHPNRILFLEKTVWQKPKTADTYYCPSGLWIEFHAVDGLPHVLPTEGDDAHAR